MVLRQVEAATVVGASVVGRGLYVGRSVGFVVGEGIGPRGGNFNTTAGLHELYGDVRLRDTPIVERGFVGLCAGAG